MPRQNTRGMATIVSMWPKDAFHTNLPYGQYDMEAAPKCTDHDRLVCEVCLPHITKVIQDTTQGVDIGFRNRVQKEVHAEDIAEDLVRDLPGAFVLSGDVKPTKEQLQECRNGLIARFQAAVTDADGSWNRYHDSKLITESARMGVVALGLKREWLSDTTSKKQCDSCGDFVPVTVIKCKCGAVYDWQKAFERGMLSKDQAEFGKENGLFVAPTSEGGQTAKRGPGRPRKEEAVTA